MFKCHICGNTESRSDHVSEMFQVNNKRVLVEHIPATVCERCGDATFSRETAEKIRIMLHDQTKPEKKIEMDVFALP
ncbi:MAG: YgiT-type zinc finger protein [Phycisphaerae bacterium]